MKRIIAGIDTLNEWMAKASGIILGAMVLLILTEILLWNALQRTTLIADEYAAYGLAIIIFLGAGYTLKEKAHIRITLLIDGLPPKPAAAVVCGATALSSVFMGYLFYYLYRMVLSSYRYGSTSGTLTETLLWIPQALLLLGALTFWLQLLAETLRALQIIRSGKHSADSG